MLKNGVRHTSVVHVWRTRLKAELEDGNSTTLAVEADADWAGREHHHRHVEDAEAKCGHTTGQRAGDAVTPLPKRLDKARSHLASRVNGRYNRWYREVANGKDKTRAGKSYRKKAWRGSTKAGDCGS